MMSLIPTFKKGQILKQDMLDALRDNPIALSNAFFAEYGDGVITGCRVSLLDLENVSISPGIVKSNGAVYVMPNAHQIKLADGRHFVYLSIEQQESSSGTVISLFAEQCDAERDDCIELFRYLRGGKLMESCSIGEIVRDTPNRIDRRKFPQSVRGGCSVCGEIFTLFAKEMLSRDPTDIRDVAFAYQCLGGIDDIDLIKAYFVTDKVLDNNAVLEMMEQKLKNLKTGVKEARTAESVPEPPRKIMVGY